MAMKTSTCAKARVASYRTGHWRVFWLWSLAVVAAVLSAQLLATPAKARGPVSVAPLAEDLIDAVVNISTSQSVKGADGKPLPLVPDGSPFEELFDDFFKKRKGRDSGRRKVASLGSGFVHGPCVQLWSASHSGRHQPHVGGHPEYCGNASGV